MSKNIPVLLFLSLSGLLGRHATKLYHFVNEQMTWTDAKLYCREHFLDLATVDSLEELERLQEFRKAIRDGSDIMWIGLHDNVSVWQWSNGDHDFNMGQQHSNWFHNSPNKNGHLHCTVISKRTTMWRNKACSTLYPSVCFNGEGQYIYVSDTMTWYKAREHCQSLNAEMASVKDATENGKVHAVLQSYAWIGLHRWSHWSDGTRATYFNWQTGQPDNAGGTEFCAGMTLSTAEYQDKDCADLNYFACHGGWNEPTFRLKISSAADMTDVEVQRRFVEQLNAKLAEKGKPGLKLKWVVKDGGDQQEKK